MWKNAKECSEHWTSIFASFSSELKTHFSFRSIPSLCTVSMRMLSKNFPYWFHVRKNHWTNIFTHKLPYDAINGTLSSFLNLKSENESINWKLLINWFFAHHSSHHLNCRLFIIFQICKRMWFSALLQLIAPWLFAHSSKGTEHKVVWARWSKQLRTKRKFNESFMHRQSYWKQTISTQCASYLSEYFKCCTNHTVPHEKDWLLCTCNYQNHMFLNSIRIFIPIGVICSISDTFNAIFCKCPKIANQSWPK